MSGNNNGEGTKFSSRVLSMKFMRKAHETDKKEEEETHSKKLKDLSEWKLPKLSSTAKLKLINKPKIKKVGYATILGDDESSSVVPIDGRRKWGEPERLEVEDEVENGKRPNKSQKESKEFLNNLWKTQRKEDDSILDSLNGGISGAGSGGSGSGASVKRKFNDGNHQYTNKKKKH